MEVFRDLPKELVEEEILTRVPATYLNGLGSTCKLWNRLFNGDRRFARKHSDKAAKQFLVLVLTRDYRICPAIVDLDGNVPTFEVKTELSLVDPHSEYPGAQFYVSRVFHCDGLLLCTCEGESRFVVWNPFTGETRWFQRRYRGGLSDRGFALGYGKNKSYKILSYHLCKKDYEIYEFSSDSWRVVDDIMPRGFALGYYDISVSLQGSTYLFSEDQTKTQTTMCLVKFDFSTEKCVPVPLPCQTLPNLGFDVACLTNVKDEKLSLLVQRERTSKTEIWVTNKIAETTQVVSWIKVLALDLSPGIQQLSYQGTFLLDEEKKVAVICDQWLDDENGTKTICKDMIYIVGEDNVVTQVEFGLEVADVCHAILHGCQAVILNYVPSLVQLKRAGGKRKRVEARMLTRSA